MSPLRLRKPSKEATDATLDRCDSPARIAHRRRWHLAFMVIYFTRALESMSKQVLGKKTDLLRSLSYVAIDVDLAHDGNLRVGGHPSLRDVDPKMLSNMDRRVDVPKGRVTSYAQVTIAFKVDIDGNAKRHLRRWAILAWLSQRSSAASVAASLGLRSLRGDMDEQQEAKTKGSGWNSNTSRVQRMEMSLGGVKTLIDFGLN
ncbi:hypothetical protein NL676_020318 [Syzygium grande]|nr:hypothetical protein NL676_020318 [Syzygium grande]